MIEDVKAELKERIEHFRNANKLIEAQRIEERTRFDIEMLIELAIAQGFENYSRYLSGKKLVSHHLRSLSIYPKMH